MAPRKTSEKPTRIWSFGARTPSELNAVNDTLYKANLYYNEMIEWHRSRYDEYCYIRAKYSPEYLAVSKEIDALDEAIKAVYREVKNRRATIYRRVREKTLDVLPRDALDKVEAFKKERKVLYDQRSKLAKDFSKALEVQNKAFKEAVQAREPNNHSMARIKAEVFEELRATAAPAWIDIIESDLEFTKKRKAIRAASGLNSGTYAKVEEAADKAAKDCVYPGFKKFSGQGKIAVQISKRSSGENKGMDLTWKDILSGDSGKLQVLPSVIPGARGKQDQYFIARINIGRERKDLWVDFPVKIHNKPPDDASVKWAWVRVIKQGERIVYKIQFVLEHKSFTEPKRESGIGDAHVKIGWSQTDSGVTVAKYGDQSVTLPMNIIGQGKEASAIDGYADVHYHNIRSLLRKYVRGYSDELLSKYDPYFKKENDEALVAEILHPLANADRKRLALRKRCEGYAQEILGDRLKLLWGAWKSHRLLHGLDLYCEPSHCSRWTRSNGIKTPKERLAFYLYIWARKDKHLRQYAADAQTNFENRRAAFYRREAIRISTQFETITVDGFNIAEIKQLPELNTRSNRPNETSQSNLHAAAPGTFRELLMEVMGPRASKVTRSDTSIAA